MKKTYRETFEIHSSPKILFNYLSTATGLVQWFADRVDIDEDKNYIIEYDDRKRLATKNVTKNMQTVKFEFIDNEHNNSKDFLELKMERSDLTNSLFVRVTEFCDDYETDEEFFEIWEGLIESLKEIIAG